MSINGQLLRACCDGDAKLAKEAIRNGADVDFQLPTDGSTALMFACQNGHSQCVKLLLQHGVNVDIQNQNGWNALMFACQEGHSQCVELLLQHGVHVDIQTQKGSTALMLACLKGHSQCVELLLKHGVNVDIRDQDGSTVLMIACENGHSQCVELLLKHGVNVDKPSSDGSTALMFACQNGHSQCVKLLLQHGVNVDIQNQNGWNALMFACMSGRVQCVNLLIESGRATNIINVIDKSGTTAVNETCRRGSPRILHLLVDAKADLCSGVFGASDLLHHKKTAYSNDEKLAAGMEPIPYFSSYERDLAGFVLMCGGYDLRRALFSVGHLREDYHRAHALLEELQCELLSVLDTDVVVDTRLHRKENGLYHEPLEQVLAYSGMLLKPQVLNIHEDDNCAGRLILSGSFEAIKMAFDRHFTRVCCVCRKTSTEAMKTCSCHCVRYCSTLCQKQDWSVLHKKEHKKIMEERQRNNA